MINKVSQEELIEQIAQWLEVQRNDVPATGEEFAAAIRSDSEFAQILQSWSPIPAGWKVVPIEPTSEMIAEALDCQEHDPADPAECEFYHQYVAAMKVAPVLDTRVKDNGPWKLSNNGKSLQSDDFTFDVRIDVDGDFGGSRSAYMKWLCNLLNSKTSQPV